MAQIKLFKLGSSGKPREHNSAADDITFNSITVNDLVVNNGIKAQSVDNEYTASVAVAARDVVYISSTDAVSPADASAESTGRVIGLAVTAALAGAQVDVRSAGVMDGFSGLTPGAVYYLDAATPGAITSTFPSGDEEIVVQVGMAKSATELQIQVQSIVVRETD